MKKIYKARHQYDEDWHYVSFHHFKVRDEACIKYHFCENKENTIDSLLYGGLYDTYDKRNNIICHYVQIDTEHNYEAY